jgi:hypothetical protein
MNGTGADNDGQPVIGMMQDVAQRGSRIGDRL